MGPQNQKNESNRIVQHPAIPFVILHLLPGIIATALYLIHSPIMDPQGYPSILAFLFTTILIVIPLELGIIFFSGYRLYKEAALESFVFYINPLWNMKGMFIPGDPSFRWGWKPCGA